MRILILIHRQRSLEYLINNALVRDFCVVLLLTTLILLLLLLVIVVVGLATAVATVYRCYVFIVIQL